MVNKLKNKRFNDIIIEDASFKVAPSVLHVTAATIGFVIKQLIKTKI